MIKVAIVGGGSASMVSAATICYVSAQLGMELTLITDPNISPIRVGESMSPMLVKVMNTYLKLFDEQNACRILEDLDMMPRIGARHTWEDDTHPSFDINYALFAAHFDSGKFTKFVRKRLKQLYPTYSEINDTIKAITQTETKAIAHGQNMNYEYDYIIDCRGFPTSDELASGEYNFPAFETVNSLLVYQHKFPYTHLYTDNRIHRNGWQFGINTSERKAYGYLYNKEITSKEDALRHYMSYNKNVPIVESDVQSISWKFYSSKKGLNNRIIKMGNKLYFFEPIQGIPLHHYSIFTSIVIDYIMAKQVGFNWDYKGLLDNYPYSMVIKSNNPEDAVNEFHAITMNRYFEIICSNYIGNSMNSEFWRITKHKCLRQLLGSHEFMTFARKVVNFESENRTENDYPDFYIHKNVIIEQYMKGLGVDFQEIVNTEPQSLLNKYS